MKKYYQIVVSLVCWGLFSVYAQETEESVSLLDPLNARIPGEVGVKLQSIFMGRDFDYPPMEEQHAGSSAVILDYLSDDFSGFLIGAQYIYAAQLYSGGSDTNRYDSAYKLHNSNYDILNKLYLKYHFGQFGWERSYLKIGRLALDLNFIRKYNLRYKDQAVEAAVVHLGDYDDWVFDFGHLEKFSSWTSKNNSSDPGIGNAFEDIEHVEDVPYSTPGFQFLETVYTGFEDSTISFYDYYGHDLYNSFGLHVDHVLHAGEWKTVLKARYITQNDIGRFPQRLNTHAGQFGIQFKRNSFSIEEGLFMVKGSAVKLPFNANLIITEPLLGPPGLYDENSHTIYLESSYSCGKHGLYGLFLHTDYAAGHSAEADLIYGYDATDNFCIKVKLAYAYDDASQWASDYRLCVGYQF